MRANNVGRFFIESLKKKPKIKAYYDNLENYTVEEIAEFDIPLWYRDRLVELKQQNFVRSEKNERMLALRDFPFVIIHNPNPKGRIYSSNIFWFLKMTNVEQEIDEGSLLFVGSNFMLVDGRFKNNLNDLDLVLRNCSFVEEADELTYRSVLREMLNEKVF